ncbi:MAG TPA: SDR family NAD(P)-dependent oxidoreductase, partial [Acidimicrobiales bacterium]|nr:SDR family NAD(P)-dependent oxidoreductase [Acidimicrobiales bacterium]
MRGLTGMNVIVTGAASGIGRATAARLLEEEANVVGADIVEGVDLPAVGAGAWAYTTVDVGDESSVVALIDEAARVMGRIDGLVNAAGVAGGGPVHLLDADEWARVLRVNLFGTFATAKHAVTRMLDQTPVDGRRGAIVTIASVEGIEGTAGGSSYSASKGGVVILTKNMAIDYAGRGIRVNTICPGFIDTPMTAGIFGMEGMEEPRRDIIAEHKLGRFGQPSEIASAAAFLLSADASFITGHALVV